MHILEFLRRVKDGESFDMVTDDGKFEFSIEYRNGEFHWKHFDEDGLSEFSVEDDWEMKSHILFTLSLKTVLIVYENETAEELRMDTDMDALHDRYLNSLT